MNTLRSLLAGTAKDVRMQNIFDYGVGGALGIGGQAALNAVTSGADPNPVLSGVLMAPALTYGLRKGRAKYYDERPIPNAFNQSLLGNMDSNPYQKAALYGSAASMVGGLGGSIYNSLAGGADIDNNIPAAALAAIVPIAAYLASRAKQNYINKVDDLLADFDPEAYVNEIKKQVDNGLL
jgi:hypothetical protein